MIDGIIVQGSSPEHTLTLPFDTSFIKNLVVSYCQNEKEVLTKRLEDCAFNLNKISVGLSQEETFLFSNKYLVTIEMRILDIEDEVHTIDPVTLRVKKSTNKEILS